MAVVTEEDPSHPYVVGHTADNPARPVFLLHVSLRTSISFPPLPCRATSWAWWGAPPTTRRATSKMYALLLTCCSASLLSLLQDYFVGVVGRTTDNSARHVKAYVHRYLAAQLAAAREQLQSYAAAFSLAMADALDVVRQGELRATKALVHVGKLQVWVFC